MIKCADGGGGNEHSHNSVLEGWQSEDCVSEYSSMAESNP